LTHSVKQKVKFNDHVLLPRYRYLAVNESWSKI
jgi:hypothetical protein